MAVNQNKKYLPDSEQFVALNAETTDTNLDTKLESGDSSASAKASEILDGIGDNILSEAGNTSTIDLNSPQSNNQFAIQTSRNRAVEELVDSGYSRESAQRAVDTQIQKRLDEAKSYAKTAERSAATEQNKKASVKDIKASLPPKPPLKDTELARYNQLITSFREVKNNSKAFVTDKGQYKNLVTAQRDLLQEAVRVYSNRPDKDAKIIAKSNALLTRMNSTLYELNKPPGSIGGAVNQSDAYIGETRDQLVDMDVPDTDPSDKDD